MEKLDFNNQLAKVAMILDKLQVELCEDTPYEIPSANETRERILKAMNELELLEKSHKEKINEIYEEWGARDNFLHNFYGNYFYDD